MIEPGAVTAAGAQSDEDGLGCEDVAALMEQAHHERNTVKNYPRAIELYQAAIACEPTALAYLSLGGAFTLDGRDDEAEPAYRAALALDPNPVVKYRSLGELAGVFLRRGEYETAIDLATQSIAVDSQRYPTAWAIRAQAYEKLNQLNEALADRTMIVELVPNHWHSHYARGLVHEKLGDWQNAISDFARALEVNSSRREPRARIAAIQQEQRLAALDEALRLVEEGEGAPELPEIVLGPDSSCGGGDLPEGIGRDCRPLTVQNVWSTTLIPVCWERTSSSVAEALTAAQIAQRKVDVRRIVEATWQRVSAVDFFGWGDCRSDTRGIHVQITIEGSSNVGESCWFGLARCGALGEDGSGSSNGMQLNLLRGVRDETVIHEFGHALGFIHEQNNQDVWGNCAREHAGSSGGLQLTPFDIDSIMNYCADVADELGEPDPLDPTMTIPFLSTGDIEGVRLAYGTPDPERLVLLSGERPDQINCSLDLDGTFDLTKSQPRRGFLGDCRNDETTGIRLQNFRAGRVIRIYDNPGGARKDDWVEIETLAPIGDETFVDVENIESSSVRVTNHLNNGLRGKISRVEIVDELIGGTIDLYDDEGGRGDLVCSVLLESRDYDRGSFVDFTETSSCDNDAARSAVLTNISEPTVITVFEDSHGSILKPFTVIEVLAPVRSVVVNDFDAPQAAAGFVEVRPSGVDGDVGGKASGLTIGDTPASGAFITMWSENNATGSAVCRILLDNQIRRINLTDGGDCDNDEARSASLFFPTRGLRIWFYDDSSCLRADDDSTEIEILSAVDYLNIPTFEANVSGRSDYQQTYRARTGQATPGSLDGKVSCIVVLP